MTDSRVNAALETVIRRGLDGLRDEIRAELERERMTAPDLPVVWADLRQWRQEDDPPDGEVRWLWDGQNMGLGIFSGGRITPFWSEGAGIRMGEVRAWAKFETPAPPVEVT